MSWRRGNVSVDELRRAGFTQLHLAELRPAGKFDVAGPDGRLWRRALGVRGEGRRVGLDAYAVDADGLVVWFAVPPSPAPQTLAEFEARAEQARQVQAEREALCAQAVPVVLDDLGVLVPLAKRGTVAAGSVPDRHVLPSGRVAP